MSRHKSLYNEVHRYTPEAVVLDDDARNLIAPLFKRYAEMGYSPREISQIIQRAVFDIELLEVL